MSIIPRRRKTDQLVDELAAAYRRIGIMYAVTIIRPPLERGDADSALALCDRLAEEVTR